MAVRLSRPKGEIDDKLHLHARSIDIAHPDGGRLMVTAPLPPHMLKTWELLGFDPNRKGGPVSGGAQAMKKDAAAFHQELARDRTQGSSQAADDGRGIRVQHRARRGLDLVQLQVLHGRLPPGVRSNPPVASRDEEEFLFILEGTPDLWLDGYLYRLNEGDGVSMPHGTGAGRAILNNSQEAEVRFILSQRRFALWLEVRPSRRRSTRKPMSFSRISESLDGCAEETTRPP